MYHELPKQLSDFDSQMRLIDSVWLKLEISSLRPSGISDPGFSTARRDAQVKPSTNLLTLNEAVRLIFVCLYKPNKKSLIKSLINGPNLNAIHPLKLNDYVNQWIQTYDYQYARNLVIQIYQFKLNLSVDALKVEAKKLGVEVDMTKLRTVLRLPRQKRLRAKTILNSSQTRTIALNLPSLSK